MIDKNDLINKYVTYLDKDGKQRIGRVVKISGNTLTVVNVLKVKHRVYKDNILGRQFRKRGIEPIKWGK